tara:strand:+ start:9950 stop:10237 length:288 start_codon:yes stop_codon:yes gene_type:complete
VYAVGYLGLLVIALANVLIERGVAEWEVHWYFTRVIEYKKPPTDSSFRSRVLRIFKRSSDTKAMKTAQRPSGMELPYRAAEIVVDDRACDVLYGD